MHEAPVTISAQPPTTILRGARRVPGLAFCFMLLGLALAALLPVPVAAHTSLLQTDPAPNSTLDHSPELVTLSFDQPLQPGFSKLTIFDAEQRPVTTSSNP